MAPGYSGSSLTVPPALSGRSRRHTRVLAATTLICLLLAIKIPAADAADASRNDRPRKTIDFNFQVRPILSDKCFNCHGPDPRNRKAGLRLDTKEGAFGATQVGRPRHRARQPRGERARSRGSPPRTRPSGCRPSRWADAVAAGDRPPQALDRARRRVAGALVVPAAGRGAGPRGQEPGLAPKPDRSLRPGPSGGRAADARARGRARSG